MLKLRIEDEEGQETIVPIIRDEITIGRQEGNTIRLTERNVSRRHARLVREGDELWVEEISARYGTLKNGKRIMERTSFRLEDQIRIGDYSLTLQSDEPMAARGPSSSSSSSSDFAAEPTAIKPLSNTPRRAQEGTEILPAMPAKLVIISSNFAGQEFPLARKQMIIGRGEDCDIIIDHRSVSQRHAKIIRENGTTYQIVDLNSKNGIRIGGEKYTSTYIKRGDVVELGHVKFRFVEPGENYVFTPSSIDDDEATEFISTRQTSSKKPLIIGAVAVGLLVLVAGAVAMMGPSDSGKTPTDEPAVTNGALAANTDDASSGDVVDTGSPSNDAEPGNEKIARGIEAAREKIGEGDVEKAIGILEGLEYAEPNANEKEQIEALLLQAKNERPFQDTYRNIETNLKEGQHLTSLKQINSLPDHTLFAKLAEERQLRDKALDGSMEQAQLLLKDGDRDGAKELLDELLDLEQDYDPAVQLLASMSKSAAVTSKKSEPSTRKDPVQTSRTKEPPKKKLTREEGNELRNSANKKVLSGDPSGAIADCKQALTAGISDCHRIMGIAYKLQGNTPKACASFKKSLRSNPSTAKGIQNQMEKLGCEME